MYTKLIKHETKAILRYLVPLYILLLFATLSMSIVSRIPYIREQIPLIITIFAIGYLISMILLSAATVFLIIYRFYKNLMTGEGYLMFTLPVSTNALVVSKFVTSFFSMLLTLLFVFTSLFTVGSNFPSIQSDLQEMRQIFSFHHLIETVGCINIILGCIIMLFLVGLQILFYYLCIAIGQMLSQNKIVGSLLSYIVLSGALQIASIIFMILAGCVIKNPYDISSYISILLPILLVIVILGFILIYGIIHVILKKKLNLE